MTIWKQALAATGGMLLAAAYLALAADTTTAPGPATQTAATTAAPTQPGQRFGRRGGGGGGGRGFLPQVGAEAHVGVHDPSIIKQGDWYYIFSTNGGLQVRRSQDLVHWLWVGQVFTQLPAWCAQEIPAARGAWAPDISFHNGEYRLYYAISMFGQRRSCIGLATNVTLDPADPKFKWVDKGKVVESQLIDNYNAIDPNYVLDEAGESWLVFGSYWTGIKMRRLDGATGMASKTDTKLYALAQRVRPTAIEAPFIVHHDGYYFLFVSFDKCCQAENSTYKIMVGRSKEITGPYVDKESKAMKEGGASLVLQSEGDVRGPGHCAVLKDGDRWLLVHHFYDAANRGQAAVQVRPLTWDEAGWPVAGKPLG